MISLNRKQRGVLFVVAIVILAVQLAAIADDGIRENRGWPWTLALASVLLVVALSSGTPADKTPKPERPAPSPMRQQPSEAMQLLNTAARLVNQSQRIASALYAKSIQHGLYHSSGTLAALMHPAIQSGLAVYCLIVLFLENEKIKPNALVWSTYRTTFARRLAKTQDQYVDRGESTDFVEFHSEMITGQMNLLDGAARKSAATGDLFISNELFKHLAIAFNSPPGTKNEEILAATIRDLQVEIRTQIAPVFSSR